MYYILLVSAIVLQRVHTSGEIRKQPRDGVERGDNFFFLNYRLLSDRLVAGQTDR